MTDVSEPQEVAEGLSLLALRTPTLPPATHTNAYLVGTGELVVVEPASPYADEVARVERWIEARLARGEALRAILLTHHHADHIGGAAAVQRRFGVPIWAHASTAARLAGKLTVDRLLGHGESIALAGRVPLRLEAVHTPGHAPGHLCFFERRSGSLIAGDMVAGVGTILVEPTDGDMQQYLASLAAMAALAPSQLLPAHGPPIDNPSAWLAFYVQHRLAREAKVVAALAALARPASLDELLPLAYADTDRSAHGLARGVLHAHLIKLEREGRAQERAGTWQLLSA